MPIFDQRILQYPAPFAYFVKSQNRARSTSVVIHADPQTLKSYVSAIKAKLTADQYQWNDELVYLSALTRACKIKNDMLRTRLPIQKTLLICILCKVERRYILSQEPYLSTLFKVAYVIGYYGLMRVGEITFSQHVVKAKDVHTGENKDKILIVLHTSKTHKRANRPQKIVIERDNWSVNSQNLANLYNPISEIVDYLHMRRAYLSDEEPFLIYKNGQPLTSQDLRSNLKDILATMNLNPDLYDTHSLRIGRATDLFKHGVTVEEIKSLGCWKSKAVYKYLRS